MRTGPCTAGDRAVVAMDDGDARPPRVSRRIVVKRPRQASHAQTIRVLAADFPRRRGGRGGKSILFVAAVLKGAYVNECGSAQA